VFLNCKNLFRFFVQVGNELSYLALFCFLVLSRARVWFLLRADNYLAFVECLRRGGVGSLRLQFCSAVTVPSPWPDGKWVNTIKLSQSQANGRPYHAATRYFKQVPANKHRVLAVFIDLAKAY